MFLTASLGALRSSPGALPGRQGAPPKLRAVHFSPPAWVHHPAENGSHSHQAREWASRTLQKRRLRNVSPVLKGMVCNRWTTGFQPAPGQFVARVRDEVGKYFVRTQKDDALEHRAKVARTPGSPLVWGCIATPCQRLGRLLLTLSKWFRTQAMTSLGGRRQVDARCCTGFGARVEPKRACDN